MDDESLDSHDQRSLPLAASHAQPVHAEKRIPRRVILRTLCAGTVSGGLGLAGCSGTNSGGNKVAKAAVNYQKHPRTGQQCSDCRYYRPSKADEDTGRCTKVEGKIAPDAWCSLYSSQ